MAVIRTSFVASFFAINCLHFLFKARF